MEIWNISQWWAITILLYSSHVSGFTTYTIGDHKLQRLNRLTWKSIKSVNLAVDQPEDEIQQNKPTNLFFDRATLSSLLVGNELTSTIKNQKTVSLTRVAVALIFIHFCGSQILQFFLTGFQNGVAWYLTQLEASPIITKSITSGIIGIFGDYFAQLLEFKMKRRRRKSSKWKDCLSIHGHYDTRRGLAILGDGLFISGPLMHWAYNRFEAILPIDGHWAAMTHVVADSILLDSVFVTTAFIMTGLLEGYSFVNERSARRL